MSVIMELKLAYFGLNWIIFRSLIVRTVKVRFS